MPRMIVMTPVKAAKAFHIPSLDGIRAVSFLIVFVSHDRLEMIPGLFGVAVFFFLSGYLITTLMRIEVEKTGTLSIRDFYLRRAFRILPPFYLVLAILVLVVKAGWLAGSYSSADLAASALYLTNYWDIYVHPINMPGFNIFWSLAVEEHFYLLFPFLMLWMLRLRLSRQAQASVLLGICALVLAWRCVLVYHFHTIGLTYGPVHSPLRTWYGTDTRVDSILFGCILALWGNPVLDRQSRHNWLATGAGIVVLMGTFVFRNPEFRETFRYTLQAVALVPLFISAISLHEHWAFRWLNHRYLQVIGVLSYVLYLIHFPALILASRWSNNRAVAGAIALSISLAFAYVVHRVVEKPAAQLRKKWGSRTAEVLERAPATEIPAGYQASLIGSTD